MVLNELAALRKNVTHVKDIVSMQQNYAKVSGVIETVQLTELLEDTLRMNAGSLARHDLRVIREYGPVPGDPCSAPRPILRNYPSLR